MKYKVLEGFVLPEDMRDDGKAAKVGSTIDFKDKHKGLIGILLRRGKIEAIEAKSTKNKASK